ncbi:MAG: dienelactone hydrolase family protein [Chloroflexota bacterium]|nr:dienelactone hydrolase family protein [Chloroflexota bacterium]
MIEYRAGDVGNTAYLAAPRDGGPGVLVLHAWWGLTPFFKGLCDRLAGEGFIALAPYLYGNRATAATIEEAERLVAGMDGDRTYALITAAIDRLRSSDGVQGENIGVVGFSLGGAWALLLEDHISAVVTFYEAGNPENISADASFQGHFAEQDEYAPPEDVRRLEEGLRAKGREIEVYTYPGTGHWFFEEDRPGHYNADAAQLAWERTVRFLRDRLTSAGKA